LTIKILDLFAGAGGLSLGFELFKDADGKKVFELFRAVEIDKYACETLRNRYGAEKVIEGDLTKKETHQRVINECKGVVSIVMGGIPCQSFSLIGPRSGYGRNNEKFKKDERDNLYLEFKAIVDEIKPKVIVIENVKGILSKKDTHEQKIIDKIIADFGKDYNLANNRDGKSYMLLNALHYGVPQRRERVVIIGVRKSWKNINVPYPPETHFEPGDNDADMLRQGLLPAVEIFDAIGDMPPVSAQVTKTGLSPRQKILVSKSNKSINSGEERVLYGRKPINAHLEKIGPNGINFFAFVHPNGHKYLDHHTARMQQKSDIELFKALKPGETAEDFMLRRPKLAKKLIKYGMKTFRDKYRRQEWSGYSTTIFAHLEKDGNRFIHPEQPRTITPREAARLQSFPDDFVFLGPTNKKFKQIGNAVPPLLSFNIARCIYFMWK